VSPLALARTHFCSSARKQNIDVVAGVAPGLDFNFKDLPGGPDYHVLVEKCSMLLDRGAQTVSILLDDIAEDFPTRAGKFTSEGCAHASLSNLVGNELDKSLWITPRVYANELAISDTNYLPDFIKHLDVRHKVVYCGSDVVARVADVNSVSQCAPNSNHSMVLWDNLYANDYCPRRLFLGPWQGRSAATHVVLNPTGMIETDCLLLDVMSNDLNSNHAEDVTALAVWKNTLKKHGVPDAFFTFANYFHHPVFNDTNPVQHSVATSETFAAIETCLWQWKSPLSREWYPYIFGLKHDLLLADGLLPPDRISKTQNLPLADYLQR